MVLVFEDIDKYDAIQLILTGTITK